MHVNVQFESCSKQPHEERAFDLITITELAATCTRLAVVIRDGEVLESVELHHRLSPANLRELQEAKFETMDCLEYVLTGGGLVGNMGEREIVELEGQERNEQRPGEGSGKFQRALDHEDCARLVLLSHGPIYCQVGFFSSVEAMEIR
jgi:hypothetical protein